MKLTDNIQIKIFCRIKTLTIAILFLMVNYSGYSQVVVQRSTDKVIISGIPYYVHQVKKGETAYSISRAYGISVEEFTKENPPAVFGVNEGQALRIPVKSVADVILSEPVPVKKQRDESKFIYHNLKPGETVYFLSKSYGVSENEIILSNTGIDINKLPVGAEIVVPRREFMSDRQKFDYQEKNYIYHKVLKGESLSLIAQKYGLTVRELRRENRDLRFPQVGDFVRIPGAQITEKPEVESVKTDSVPEIIPEPVIRIERPAGFTPVKELGGTLDVAVLLPFYLKENSLRTEIDTSKSLNGKKIKKVIKRSEEWIYPRSLDFVEMYEGILLAADTLRSLGLDINIYPYDIKKDTIAITKLISSGKLAEMDLIIGPVYSHNLTAVASYAGGLGIPVVSPVPLINNSALSNNTNLFMASSSLEIAQKALAKKASEFYDYNFVYYHADTSGIDEDVKRFKNQIFTELSYKLPYEEIKFKELLFYSRSMFDNDSINRLSHALSDQSKNVVIIASEETPVISETIMDVHGLSKKFDIKVLGYPAMRDLENLDPKYLFDLDINVYSQYWIDYEKNDVKQFNADFRKKFLTEPVEKSYAWQGYDIAYYFLSGMAIHGKDFIVHPEMHYPDLLQTEYDFVQKDSTGGFENQKLFLVRYTKDYEVRLVEENKLLQQK
jgi:LysM repeat protein